MSRTFGSALALAALAVGVVLGQSARPQGLEPYTPTKLDWAVLQLRINSVDTQLEDVGISFEAAPDGETVICKVGYLESSVSAKNIATGEFICGVSVNAVRERWGFPWLKGITRRQPVK